MLQETPASKDLREIEEEAKEEKDEKKEKKRKEVKKEEKGKKEKKKGAPVTLAGMSPVDVAARSRALGAARSKVFRDKERKKAQKDKKHKLACAEEAEVFSLSH